MTNPTPPTPEQVLAMMRQKMEETVVGAATPMLANLAAGSTPGAREP